MEVSGHHLPFFRSYPGKDVQNPHWIGIISKLLIQFGLGGDDNEPGVKSGRPATNESL